MNQTPASSTHSIDHSFSEFYRLLENNLEVGAADNFKIIAVRYDRMKQLHNGFKVEGLDRLISLYRIRNLGPEYRHLFKQIIGLAQGYFMHLEQQAPHHL